MKHIIQQLFQDKSGRYSLREVVIGICVLLIVSSWIAQIGFGIQTPEAMFYAVISLVAAGCFGYSIEKNIHPNDSTIQNLNNNKKK